LSKATILLVFFAFGMSACGSNGLDEEPSARHVEQALGEPFGSFPSLSERRILYLTNRARTEPGAFNPSDVYPPSPPLRWDLSLSEAARFHARHIAEEGCWCEDHSSCCELAMVDGEVQCTGPSTGCGTTSSEERVALFSSAYRGENMAQGYPTASAAIEGWTQSPGHWANMNSPSSTLLGPGHVPGAWVQDFGAGGSPPVIGDGIHLTAGQGATFGATFYQPGSDGPRSALVIVNGECNELDLAFGEADHGAFETTVALEPGCHRYYFHFTDGNGNHLTYPSAGSLGVGMGSECQLFVEERPADTCSPSGQSCRTGDARSCYTGPFGTRDQGICTSGVERCVSGQWTGECNDEVGPEERDVCGNGLDDNCDGAVDETCSETEDVGQLDMGSSSEMEPARETDMEEPVEKEPQRGPSGGCSTMDVPEPDLDDLLLIGVIAMIGGARRRRL